MTRAVAVKKEDENLPVGLTAEELRIFADISNDVFEEDPIPLLKFQKGEYFLGQDSAEVEIGSEFVAIMTTLRDGWIVWQDGRPVERYMPTVLSGERKKSRDQMGYEDETLWEDGPDGQPRDPVQPTMTIQFVPKSIKDPKPSDAVLFSTSTKGGMGAIKKLIASWVNTEKKHPGKFPVIKLKVGSYAHPNKSYGRIKYPEFEVVDWVAAK